MNDLTATLKDIALSLSKERLTELLEEQYRREGVGLETKKPEPLPQPKFTPTPGRQLECEFWTGNIEAPLCRVCVTCGEHYL